MKFRKISSLGLALVLNTADSALAAQAPTAPAPAPAPAAAPATPAPADSTIVGKITIDGKTVNITYKDLMDRAKSLPAQIQAAAKERRKEIYAPLLNSAIDMMLITLAAQKAGLDKNPDVLALMENSKIAALQKKFLDDKIDAAAKSPEGKAELKKVFEEVSKSLPKTDEYDLAHILVKTEKEAIDAIAKLKKGTDFAALAAEVSIDESKANGGNIGWVRMDEMPKEFSDAVKGVAKATVVQKPVKTQLGFHVIKVKEKKPATPPTFEQVEPELIQAMAAKFAQKEIEALRAAAKIEKFDEAGKPLVEEKKPDVAAPAPAVAPAPAPAPAPAVAPKA